MHKREGFYKFSELFRMKYSGFTLDKRQRVTISTKAPINFNHMIEMLKSSDESKMRSYEEVFSGKHTFFDGTPLKTRVAFNTYPRSGNSMLRKLMEQMTGAFTGGTVRLHTATSLQCMGLAGEEITDDRVWIVKAHHPGLMPDVIPFDSHKVICCIRNPIDVFVSFASLVNTLSHSAQPDYEYHKDFPQWWDYWVKYNAELHAKYFNTMIRHCTTEGKNPIYFVRYEDLCNNKQEELEGVMKFLLGVPDLKGTNAQRRIEQIVADKGASQPYRLKATTGKFNIHAPKFNKEQIEAIKDANANLLYKFGYSNHPQEQNKTAFFDFAQHKPEHLADYYGFRKINEETLKMVCDPNWEPKVYKVNTDEVFDYFTDSAKVQDPSWQWAAKKLGYSKKE